MASNNQTDETNTLQSRECPTCGFIATMICAGCKEAPEYSPGELIDTAYCSKDCQKTDWPKHKTQCAVLKKRKKLLRVAKTLKATLLAYRESAFDLDLTAINFQNGTLYLHGRNMGRAGACQFPHSLTDREDYKEAALTNNQCTLARALLGPLARHLLSGTCANIIASDITVGKPVFRTELIPGPKAPDRGVDHTILVLEMKNGEKWIIDAAGSQYGFHDTLSPRDKYFAEKDCRDLGRSEVYDACETSDVDYFLTLPFMTATSRQRENLKVARAARVWFAEFVKTRVTGNSEFKSSLFSGSEVDFQEKLNEFIRDLRGHMAGFFLQAAK